MKKLIKQQLREGLLNEGVSDVVYHFTSPQRAYNILKNNEILMAPVLNADSHENKLSGGKYFYLSTTTSRSSKVGYYAYKNANGAPMVRITLNGRQLNSRFKSYPVDYFQPLPGTSKGDNFDMSRDEMEMRVVSNNDVIKPANSYIYSVEIVNSTSENYLVQLNKLCDDLGIKFYAYDEVKYFDASHKNKAIKVRPYDDFDASFTGPNTHTEGDVFPLSNVLSYIVLNNQKISLDSVISDLDYEERIQLKSMVVEKLKTLEYDFRIKSNVPSHLQQLNNSIKSLNKNASTTFRYLIRLMVNDMKKKNIGSLKEYLYSKVKNIDPKEDDAGWEHITSEIDKYREEVVDELIQDVQLYEMFFKKVYEFKKAMRNSFYNDYDINPEEIYKYVIQPEDSNEIKEALILMINKLYKKEVINVN